MASSFGATTGRLAGRAGAAAAPRADDDDRSLLQRLVGGDERALGALYDRWSPAVHALALRIVADRDEAEDVVEETFWQAWRQAATYQAARGAVSTWLFTIARSRALDRRRAISRRREEALGGLPAEEPRAPTPAADAPADSAHDPSEVAERRTRVEAALRELPAEQREAVELAYFDGLSQTEIAERTRQPLGTVKTRMRLAMQKLRERLAPLREGVT
jgi:RNA polymerase sigma-70 factor (ECF subfamily)